MNFLQPENILFDDNMDIKLSDFGFATFVTHDKELQGNISQKYFVKQCIFVVLYNMRHMRYYFKTDEMLP